MDLIHPLGSLCKFPCGGSIVIHLARHMLYAATVSFTYMYVRLSLETWLKGNSNKAIAAVYIYVPVYRYVYMYVY